MTFTDNNKMTAVGYVFLTLMLLAFAAPASAQTDEDATVKAMRTVIGRYPAYAVEEFINKEIAPKFKKSPKVMVGIAKHFEDASDSTLAFRFVNRALAIDSKYVPAYVMMGTIHKEWAHTHEDTLVAYSWYDKAISTNPKDPEGYQAYAALLVNSGDIDAAAKKLEGILNYDPTYNVYVEIGAMYATASSAEKDWTNEAIDSYARADFSRMTTGQIAGYITLLQAAGLAGGGVGAYNRADSLLSLAIAKYPSDARLNRLMLQNSVKLKKYEQALEAADALFNKSDSLEVDLDDFMNYAQAYLGLNRYNAAIDVYQKCIDFEIKREDYKSDETYENAKRTEERKKNDAWKAMVDAYDKSGYPEKAIDVQKEYIELRREQGKLGADELNQLAKLYNGQAEILMGEEQKAAYRNAYDTYGEMIEVSPENAALGYYYRVSIGGVKLEDDEFKLGIAVDDAKNLIKLLSMDSEMSEKNKNMMLSTAYRYLSFYYFYYSNRTKKPADYRQCGEYLKQLVVFDPESSLYKHVSENKATRKQYGL